MTYFRAYFVLDFVNVADRLLGIVGDRDAIAT